MKVATCVGVLLTLVSAVGLPAAVSAQEPTAPTAARRTPEELKKLSEQALADAKSGKFEQAIQVWLDILDEVTEGGRADVHANLAVAYKMAKDLPAAWYHLTAYLRMAVREDKAAGKELEALERSLAADHGKVGITCQPEGCRVYLAFSRDAVDPTRVPAGKGPALACPLTWWFPAGDHEVLVVKEGFVPQVLKVTANVRGGVGSFAAVLEEIPAFGRLEVEGTGKAIQVFINGSLEGRVPFGRRLKAGTYELMVGRPGEEPWKKTIVIEADKTLVERPAPFQPQVVRSDEPIAPTPGIAKKLESEGRFPTWQTVLMAGGAALLAAGGVVQYLGYSANQDLLDKYPESEQDYVKWLENRDGYKKEFEDSVSPLRATSIALYGVGGAAAAAGLVWLLVDRPERGAADGAAVPLTVAPLEPSLGVGLSLGAGF